ncbi:pyridoxamine 5'-phosphate oxidase family protein [Streptomyces sp. NBC_01276]|uniref:pyridoxamine 5'-phosphate oxidase family protein n=1 Tax=Streptomyces sp. NBC_01276 TaxID=2903808 RepID=UPI00352C87EC
MSPEELHAIELLRRVPYGRVATSMRALPFLALARHIVVDGEVVLRMHAGFGYHQACNGSVVSYGADNSNSPDPHLWSVQFTGTARIVEPTTAELELFGPTPHFADGTVFDPVYMRIEPQLVTVHTLTGRPDGRDRRALPDRQYQHML